jgi:SAM-dependent methyltransferase
MERKRSETFDEVARLYDKARPGYPAELFETIIAISELPASGRILEIGCGPGKATAPFVERGYSLVCIEPGRNLAAVAAEKFRGYPNVTIETVTFEEWPLEEAQFDLVMAAQAFHWVPAEIGYAKSARALKEDGWLALFWNTPPDVEGELFDALDAVYRNHAPAIAKPSPGRSYPVRVQERADAIRRSGLFDEPIVAEFAWSAQYSAAQYLDLLNTYSDHRLLPEADRDALFAAIAEVLTRHGGITNPYVAVLYLARKRRGQ